MTDLKPCPFCGKVPEIKRCSGSYGYTPPSVYVTCCNSLHVSEDTTKWERERGHFSREKEAVEFLINRWNTRYDPSTN